MRPSNVSLGDLLRRQPPVAPYLTGSGPIDIDVGRQLFVDDWLILRTNGTVTYHQAQHARVVLEPTAQERRNQSGYARVVTHGRTIGSARPYSGGVAWDDVYHRYVMHYRCAYMYGAGGTGCVATSTDGVRWVRPQLGVSRTNAISALHPTDSFTTALDPTEEDPSRRWKLVAQPTSREGNLSLFPSSDGLYWTHARELGPIADRASFFRNPFAQRWSFAL